MERQFEKKWGPFAISAAILSITSIFINDFFAIIVAFIAVIVGFYALKKRGEHLASVGLYIGALVLIIINLYNMGIIPSQTKKDVAYLIRSVEKTIVVFNGLKKDGSENNDQQIGNVRDTLKSAEAVNIQRIDKHLAGFADHFKDEFISGLEFLEQGYSDNDTALLLRGAILLDRWALWYNQQYDELRRIRNITPSPFNILRQAF